jgi:hypothetical protein
MDRFRMENHVTMATSRRETDAMALAILRNGTVVMGSWSLWRDATMETPSLKMVVMRDARLRKVGPAQKTKN